MKKHYGESCPHRFVPCGLGCGYRIRAKVLALKEERRHHNMYCYRVLIGFYGSSYIQSINVGRILVTTAVASMEIATIIKIGRIIVSTAAVASNKQLSE